MSWIDPLLLHLQHAHTHVQHLSISEWLTFYSALINLWYWKKQNKNRWNLNMHHGVFFFSSQFKALFVLTHCIILVRSMYMAKGFWLWGEMKGKVSMYSSWPTDVRSRVELNSSLKNGLGGKTAGSVSLSFSNLSNYRQPSTVGHIFFFKLKSSNSCPCSHSVAETEGVQTNESTGFWNNYLSPW